MMANYDLFGTMSTADEKDSRDHSDAVEKFMGGLSVNQCLLTSWTHHDSDFVNKLATSLGGTTKCPEHVDTHQK